MIKKSLSFIMHFQSLSKSNKTLSKYLNMRVIIPEYQGQVRAKNEMKTNTETPTQQQKLFFY